MSLHRLVETQRRQAQRALENANLWKEDKMGHKAKAIAIDHRETQRRAALREDLEDAILARLRRTAPRDASLAGLTLAGAAKLCDIAQRIPHGTRLSGGSGDLPVIFTNSAEKHALDFYRAQRPAARRFTREIEVRSLRPATVAHLDTPALAEVGEGGRIEHGVPAEGGEVMRMARYASIVELTFESIANDDLGAFRAIPEGAAEAVSRLDSDVVFEVLLANSGAGPTLSDGVNFFHADHGNLMQAAALSAPALAAAAAAMRAQLSPSGARMNLAPRFLLVGPELEFVAHELVASHTAGGAAAVLEVLVDARIEDASWYLFSDPHVGRPAFVRGALFGRPGPQLVSEHNFDTGGIAFKVTATAGCGPADYRAAVRTPSAT